MSELTELRAMHEQLIGCTKAVERIEIALLGDKFNDTGIIKRIDTMEQKLKKIDKYMWMLIGMFSLGTIPLGTRILPIIKEYIK
jgi:hypothetical protein